MDFINTMQKPYRLSRMVSLYGAYKFHESGTGLPYMNKRVGMVVVIFLGQNRSSGTFRILGSLRGFPTPHGTLIGTFQGSFSSITDIQKQGFN